MLQIASVDGVDAIFSAHSHQYVNETVNDIPVVQSEKYGHYISQITFYYDLNQDQIIDYQVTMNDLTNNLDAFEADQEAMDTIVNPCLEQVAPIIDEIIAYSDFTLEHDRYSGPIVTPVGMWVCDMMLNQLAPNDEEVDIAMQNGGSLRTSIDQGDISYGDIYQVMPYENVYDYYYLSGAQIWEIFEYGLDGNHNNVGFLQYSGINVVGNDDGSEIYSITTTDGEVISNNDTQTYLVATSDFMGSGGDNYTTFLDGEYLGQGVSIRDNIIEQIKATDNYQFDPKYDNPDTRYKIE